MLILLDIDGVMVSAASWKRPELLNDGFQAFNGRAIKNLQKIISDTGASIVLTTSHKSNYSKLEWYQIFKNRGIVAPIDKLKDNIDNLSRKEEISNWLNTNSFSEFVIIDDDKSLNDLPVLYKDRLILTNPLVGLNDEATMKVLDIFKTKRFRHA